MKKIGLLFVTIILMMLFALSASAKEVVDNGECGANAIWTLYDDGELVVSGEGAMKDYSVSSNNGSLYCLRWKTYISKVTIDEGITRIGQAAFYAFENIESVIISSTVTSIGDYVFKDCKNLENIFIPQSVSKIGLFAFSGCNSILRFDVDENNAYYSCDEYGVLHNKEKTRIIAYPLGNKLSFYETNQNVEVIDSCSFKDAQFLEEVKLSPSVKTIGKNAFDYCINLKSVTIPEGVVLIDDHAFYRCFELVNVLIPKTVTNIGEMALGNCTALCEVVILNPNCTIEKFFTPLVISSPPVIRGYDNSTAQTFAETVGCRFISLDGYDKDVLFSYSCGDNAMLSITRDGEMVISGSGEMYNYGYSERPWHECISFVKEVSISDAITSIGTSTFEHAGQISEIVLPDSITKINSSAFEECYSLTNIKLSKAITSIEAETFKECSSLQTINIPNRVSKIGNSAFYLCTDLTSVVLPKSVNYIGDTAFVHCSKLKTLSILNPDCYIYLDKSTISDSTVIYGLENSTAQSYAKQYNRKFEIIVCNHTNVIKFEAVEATCTSSGRTEGIYCEDCFSWLVSYSNLPAKGHSFSGWIIVDKPTCEANGKIIKSCYCGLTVEETIISEGHNYEGNICKNCSKSQFDDCSCNCHKGGLAGFFFKLINFFQKIFGINKVCACGVKH